MSKTIVSGMCKAKWVEGANCESYHSGFLALEEDCEQLRWLSISDGNNMMFSKKIGVVYIVKKDSLDIAWCLNLALVKNNLGVGYIVINNGAYQFLLVTCNNLENDVDSILEATST